MDLKKSIRNQTDVSLTLAKHVSESESNDSNLVFSPLSIHVVLGLIASGSKGPTQAQLLSFLNSKSTDELNSLSSQLVSLIFADGGPSGGPRLSFANGVWVDQSLSLKPSFKQVVDTVYKAASSHVNFQTKEKCDRYKKSQARPRIHHVAGTRTFHKVKNDLKKKGKDYDLPETWKETHYSQKRKAWTDGSENLYDELKHHKDQAIENGTPLVDDTTRKWLIKPTPLCDFLGSDVLLCWAWKISELSFLGNDHIIDLFVKCYQEVFVTWLLKDG